MDHVTLRRTGDLPLMFEGEMIAEASSRWTNGRENNRWHDLRLYRTRGGAYVLSIEFRTQWQGELDHQSAVICDSPAALQGELKRHDPVPPGIGYPDKEVFAPKQARLVGDLGRGFEDCISSLFDDMDEEFAERID